MSFSQLFVTPVEYMNYCVQGLYNNDEREGPGVLTYTNGSQDVGLWFRERLTKTCFHLPSAFAMINHPEFQYFPEEQRLYLCASADTSNTCQSTHQTFTNNNNNYTINSADIVGTIASNISATDNSYKFNQSDTFNLSTIHITSTQFTENYAVVWNKTPQLLNMQKHIMQCKDLEKEVSFDINLVLNAKREKFRNPGLTELASVLLFESISEGNHVKVDEILDTYQAYVDVSDRSGFTPLMMAAVSVLFEVSDYSSKKL